MTESTVNLTENSRLHAIIQTAVEGIISINRKGIIQSFNPAAENIFLYQSDEILGKNVSVLMPAPHKQNHDSYIKNYLTGGAAKIIGSGREVIGLRKNGTTFPMWLAVAEFSEQGRQFFAGFIRDLSAEKMYLSQASSYEQILEHSLNEIYIFDAQTFKFVRVNKGGCANLQYTSDEILELTPIDLKLEHNEESFRELIDPLLKHKIDKLQFVTMHKRKDGSCYPVEVSLELAEYDNRPVFVAIILDITDRIEAQEKARVNQEQLAHMDRVSMLGEMSAGIAHEINQPLTAIATYASAGQRRLENGGTDLNKVKSLFEKIAASVHRASEVIIHMRKLLRLQSEHIDNESLDVIIKEAVGLIKTDIRSIEYEYVLELEKDLPNVIVDAVQIQQVILNLVRNAMDATRAEAKEYKKIIISAKLSELESRIQASVRDFGAGVAKENTDKLFNPFFTTKTSGMGIGLSICRSIIQEHGGKIWFENNKDKGATFHFILPTALSNDYE